ncbi:ash family protein [Leminorella grimontii]|uniref:ash family protein n=1 Tax=Leminorella grimontii TaxID=82981 RepID=UPI0034CE3C55
MYRRTEPAKSGYGIGILKTSSAILSASAFFCIARPVLETIYCRFSMVGWTEAPLGAPVPDEAGNANSVQFRHL